MSNGKQNKSNNNGNNRKNRYRYGMGVAYQRPKWKKYEDDRTPAVKKIDIVCRILAIILSLFFFLNVHVLVKGGGYNDEKVIPFMGIAASKVETDAMEPEIPAKSGIITWAKGSYQVGDPVQYTLDDTNPVSRVKYVSEDGETYTLQGDNESRSRQVSSDDIVGKVIFSSQGYYKFLKVYSTALGAAFTVVLSFILLFMSDILMFRKRKAALKEKRAEILRKREEEIRKKGIENVTDLSPIEKRQAKKQAKLEKERQEIAEEMKQLQEKMKAEEEELKRGEKKKK